MGILIGTGIFLVILYSTVILKKKNKNKVSEQFNNGFN